MEERERCYSFIFSRTPHETTHTYVANYCPNHETNDCPMKQGLANTEDDEWFLTAVPEGSKRFLVLYEVSPHGAIMVEIEH
jgi:hypothetical protein